MTQRGLTLIELMMALAIGSFLVAGAVTVYLRSSASYAINETIAGLHETARFAMSTLEAEVRLAGYWGLGSDGAHIKGASGNSPLALSGRSARCGLEFPLNLRQPLEGSNNSFALPCTASGGGAVTGADVLVTRRADPAPSPASADRLQIYTTRNGGSNALFLSGSPPGPMADAEVHDLAVHAYYVAQGSTGQTDMPALRRKTLQGGGSGPSIGDEEIMPGIEDLQVQFGIDPGVDVDGDGAPDEYTGIAARYVNPGDASLDSALIVTARIWIRARAPRPETGYIDNKTYEYADVLFTPTGDDATHRRLLISRTLQARNASGRQP